MADSEEDDTIDDTAASPSLMHYVMMGFGPFVAVLALMFAIISMARIPSLQAKMADADAKIQKLNTDLASSRIELAKLKDALRQEISARTLDDQKRDQMTATIIRNITPLQLKLRIHPTLEEQLGSTAAASGVPVTTPPSSAPAGSKADGKKPPDQVKSMMDAIKKFNAQ